MSINYPQPNREAKLAENSQFQRGSTLISDIKVEPRCPSTRIFGFPRPNLSEGFRVISLFSLFFLFLSYFPLFTFNLPTGQAGFQLAEASTIKPPVVNLGLVGHWTFDGGKIINGRIDDSSTSGYNGNTSGIATSTFYTRGKIGQAILLDGVNDYVNVPSPTNLQFAANTPFSFSFWAKPTNDAASGQVQIVGYTQDTTDGWLLVQDNAVNAKSLEFCDYDGYNYVCRESAANSFTNGNWYFVTVTVDGTNTLAGRQLYVNGVATSLTRCGGSGCTATVNINYDSNTFRLGVRDTASYWAGALDDVRVYNRVLSTAEIKRLYNIGQPTVVTKTTSTNSLATGLVGHWTFDGSKTAWSDATTGTATDSSGNNNTGTFTNMSRATAPVRGQIGQAVSFDGTDDYVSISGGASGINSGDTTWSLWVKTSTLGNTVPMETEDGNGAIHFQINVGGTGTWLWGYTSDNRVTSNAVISNGTWRHVVGVLNRSTKTVSIYVDGVFDNSAVGTGAVPTTMSDILIGSRSGTFAVAETVDDVRIYSRALSTAEIKRLYNLGRPTVVKTTFLLDKVKNAAAAYSVRKLRNAYTGSAMTVRRTSPAGSTNIGYLNGGDLDTASLLTYCASTDCFVSTWFDQSGNGRNITQATEGLQPKIVSSGSLITGSNGKSAMTFDGTDDYLTAAFTLTDPESVYLLTNIVSWTNNHVIMDGGTLDGMAIYQLGSSPNLRQYVQGEGSGVNLSNFTLGTWGIIVSIFDRNGGTPRSARLLLNASTPASGTLAGAGNGGGFTLGTRGNGQASFSVNLHAQEAVIYQGVKTESNSNIILGDQNNYFRVY